MAQAAEDEEQRVAVDDARRSPALYCRSRSRFCPSPPPVPIPAPTLFYFFFNPIQVPVIVMAYIAMARSHFCFFSSPRYLGYGLCRYGLYSYGLYSYGPIPFLFGPPLPLLFLFCYHLCHRSASCFQHCLWLRGRVAAHRHA